MEKESEEGGLVNKLASLNSKKEQIQEETKRKKMLASQREWANERIDEATEVIRSIRRFVASSDGRNIYKLNEYTNAGCFPDLYGDQSYRGVHIDKSTTSTSSHRTVRNLSRNCLSGGVRHTEPRTSGGRLQNYHRTRRRRRCGAPPFILDEPTTFLDSGHVGELNDDTDHRRWNVPQILLVSHDETLIENSDHAILVEKDPQTETSRVRSGHAAVEEQRMTPRLKPPWATRPPTTERHSSDRVALSGEPLFDPISNYTTDTMADILIKHFYAGGHA